MSAELAIGLAAKFYDARRTMQLLHGDDYGRNIADTVAKIEQAAKLKGADVFETGMQLAKLCRENAGALGLVLAGILECYEPSPAFLAAKSPPPAQGERE